MYRNLARTTLVAILALTLGLAAVAPAGAGETRKPATATTLTTHWLATVWDLVQGWLTGAPARTLDTTASATVTTSTAASDGSVSTTSGSCIDPMGRQVPCSFP